MSEGANRIDPATGGVAPVGPPAQSPTGPRKTDDGKSFGDILRTKVAERVPTAPASGAQVAEAPESTLRFSAHAAARLKQRGIELSEGQHARLENAVNKAALKGSRDALVLLDDTAMVVSVKNKTVITALGMQQAKENVFTNIDSAVVA
jgi:flagellar operon protein